MSSADVTHRMIRLAQTLVGHLRGGLAQVVTLFSMFFAGISGSSAADVAVLSRTVAPEMDRERYDRAFTAALIASASTMANLIPPSIMAVVYGATGNVSIGGLFLGGVVPGVLIGVGLMIYSYFFGPVGTMKKRARLVDIFVAARGSALPMVIPVIIMGGILTGWFTPTEAGMAAAAYILLVLIPALNPRHIRRLPGDFMYTGPLRIDVQTRDVRVGSARVQLAQKEYELLLTLAREPERVFTKAELLHDVWDYRASARTRTLDSHASRLRRKLRQ